MLLIKSISAQDPILYISHLYRSFRAPTTTEPQELLNKIEKLPIELPLKPTQELDEAFPESQREIDFQKKLFTRYIRHQKITLPDEIIHSEKFSYLKEDTEYAPRRTPVFFRETNKGSFYYLFLEYRIERGFLIQQDSPWPNERQLPASAKDKLIKLFITTLAKAIGSKIGTGILKQLFNDFGACSPREMQELFDDLKRYIEDQKIKDIGAYLRERTVWLRDDYAVVKKNYPVDKPDPLYTPTKIYGDLNVILDRIQECSALVEAHSVYESRDDHESFDRRRLLGLNANLIMFAAVLRCEMMYWNQYILDHSSQKVRMTRDKFLNFLNRNINRLPGDFRQTITDRRKKITYVVDDSLHPDGTRSFIYWDDYIRWNSGHTPHPDDTWRCTLKHNVHHEAWTCPDGKKKARERIDSHRRNYVKAINENISKSAHPLTNSFHDALKTTYLYYIDSAVLAEQHYWFFSRDILIKRSLNRSNSLGNPIKISSEFKGFPSLGKTQIDGVTYNHQEKCFYFFIDDNYYQFSSPKHELVQTGKITDKWRGVHLGGPADCVVSGASPSLTCFFKDKNFWVHNSTTDTAHKDSISNVWPGIMQKCNAAMIGPDHYFFFRGVEQQVFHYAPPKAEEPIPISEFNW
ncbi:MAG: hypothetical protein AAGD01_00975 [Acidobacteriota bacterium]